MLSGWFALIRESSGNYTAETRAIHLTYRHRDPGWMYEGNFLSLAIPNIILSHLNCWVGTRHGKRPVGTFSFEKFRTVCLTASVKSLLVSMCSFPVVSCLDSCFPDKVWHPSSKWNLSTFKMSFCVKPHKLPPAFCTFLFIPLPEQWCCFVKNGAT